MKLKDASSNGRQSSAKTLRRCVRAASLAAFFVLANAAHAQTTTPVVPCSMAGIGSVPLVGDGAPVTILAADPMTTAAPASVPYCLVKVLIPQAINIWIGLPDRWNSRWQSLGGGGYAGAVSAPTSAVNDGYAGATTDTGHSGGSGTFGMTTTAPLGPDTDLQIDFAYRSEHLMAVIGKELAQAYYGSKPVYSYWNGCSTGGRQGLMMAQLFPNDYDGILAGAPAIHWDRFQAQQIWPQMAMFLDNGGIVGSGTAASLNAKQALATNAAINACDALDGVVDGVLTDPRDCEYQVSKDPGITTAACTPADTTCLTPTEASAIDKMWEGPVSCGKGLTPGSCAVSDLATRKLGGKSSKRLWYGQPRGAALNGLGGATPFAIAIAQPRYWVYFDPTWDWHTLTYDNYLQFFRDTVANVGPIMASDDPDLAPFRDSGGKVLIWQGFADQLITPLGTIEYYDKVVDTVSHGNYKKTQRFARFFLAPGVAHCGGGAGYQPLNLFQAVVDWVEDGTAPKTVMASRVVNGVTQTRPLCMYPQFAKYIGTGDVNNAANFVCADE